MEKELLEALAAGYTVILQSTNWGGYTCRVEKKESTGDLADREWAWTGYDYKLPNAVTHGIEAMRDHQH